MQVGSKDAPGMVEVAVRLEEEDKGRGHEEVAASRGHLGMAGICRHSLGFVA